ncbi:hypothetical protein PoB_001656900 [Plakobranchus ocellatus]|uniref:Uncharacterized protein n=1 Tax=Plakobranchus ocellatus TaxID=259542 RepID=A0AAV3Z6Q4_9GAST|nr:hypothetical protein PoB_001656900 [Plakobranchus ocellatus]
MTLQTHRSMRWVTRKGSTIGDLMSPKLCKDLTSGGCSTQAVSFDVTQTNRSKRWAKHLNSLDPASDGSGKSHYPGSGKV